MPYPDPHKQKYSNPLHGDCHLFVKSFSLGTIPSPHLCHAVVFWSKKQGRSSKTEVIPEVVMGMLY
jgi:hypothetical protein